MYRQAPSPKDKRLMNNPSVNKLKKAVRLKHIDYWLNSADHDLEVAETLFQNEKYDWCLFIAHLVLEKTLKAFYVKIQANCLLALIFQHDIQMKN